MGPVAIVLTGLVSWLGLTWLFKHVIGPFLGACAALAIVVISWQWMVSGVRGLVGMDGPYWHSEHQDFARERITMRHRLGLIHDGAPVLTFEITNNSPYVVTKMWITCEFDRHDMSRVDRETAVERLEGLVLQPGETFRYSGLEMGDYTNDTTISNDQCALSSFDVGEDAQERYDAWKTDQH